MSLINVTNLTFYYDGSYDNIFEDVSLQIDTDWKLGFTARNGRGKTTFLNLLMGKYSYKGLITATVKFDYFPYSIKDPSKLSVDIAEEIIGDFQLWELEKELSVLEVNLDILQRPFLTLSNGEQTKLLLAALFLNPGHFLLIDEPTNHLDLGARKAVSNYLKRKSGFILVSHDRRFIDNCVDHIFSINKTNIEIQAGNFSSWWHNKEMQDSFELAENEKLQKDINRLSASAKQKSKWSDAIEKTKSKRNLKSNSGLGMIDKGFVGHQSAKMMKKSKRIESRQTEAIESKSKLLKNVESVDKLLIKQLNYHSHNLLELLNVEISYDDKSVCKNVNFQINQGDRLAVIGKNGCGKSSLLKLILGENIPYSGNVRLGSGLVISYVSQDTSFLKGDLKTFAKNENIDESLFKAILRQLDFNRIQFEKNIEDFSGGQKKKVLLAKSLCTPAHLYIWDEPLNFIDVFSRMQIEDLILTHKPTLLFVEHDEAFSENIATKTLRL